MSAQQILAVIVVFMTLPIASSARCRELCFSGSRLKYKSFSYSVWQGGEGIKVVYIQSSLALNSPYSFSCYLPASHMISHKSWAPHLVYQHLLYPGPHYYPQNLQHLKGWLPKVCCFKWNHLFYSSAHVHDKASKLLSSPTPETEFSKFLDLLSPFTAVLLTEEPWQFITWGLLRSGHSPRCWNTRRNNTIVSWTHSLHIQFINP